MKKNFLVSVLCFVSVTGFAQQYPEPEFSNEIYYLKKDSVYSLVRLEKENSAMDTKTKWGGAGGSESGYTIEGERSPVRFSNGDKLSFIFSTMSAVSSSSNSSPTNDSMMRANGADPSMINNLGGMMDPLNTITLYKTETEKGVRKILLQKSGGMLSFGNHKPKSSEKYTFSVKKIKAGYWEFVIDKNLPKGEYAFTMMNTMNMGDMMSAGMQLFAFAID